MNNTHLALLAVVSTSLVSSAGAFCQTRGNTNPPSDADPGQMAEGDPSPFIICPRPQPFPTIHACALVNPFTGDRIEATICVSPYLEGGDGQISIYLNQPVNVYGATVVNLSTGQSGFVNTMTSTYITAVVRYNGVYRITVLTSQGEYTGTISVNNLSGPQVPCDTIDDGIEGGIPTLPPANRFPHP